MDELTVEQLEALLVEAKMAKREANQKRKNAIKEFVKPTEDMTDRDYLMLEIGMGEAPYQKALRYLYENRRKKK